MNEVKTFELTLVSGKKTWQLSFLADSLRIQGVGHADSFDIPRAEVPEKAVVSQLWPLAPVLAVKKPKKVMFQLTRVDAAAIRAWWPPATYRELKWVFRKRFWFAAVFGVFLLLTSLPVSANPEAGIDATPFDLESASIGVLAIVFAVLARWFPFRSLFLVECLGCLAAMIHNVVSFAMGERHWGWLIFVWFLLAAVRSEFLLWKRFASVTELPDVVMLLDAEPERRSSGRVGEE